VVAFFLSDGGVFGTDCEFFVLQHHETQQNFFMPFLSTSSCSMVRPRGTALRFFDIFVEQQVKEAASWPGRPKGQHVLVDCLVSIFSTTVLL
jgi:hypothetical protein